MKRILILFVVATALLGAALASPATAGNPTQCTDNTVTDNDRFACRLYNTGLDRVPANAEITFWAARVASQGHGAVARDILFSDEAVESVINSLYSNHLGRGVDPAGLAFWLDVAHTTGRTESVSIGVAASDENFTDAGSASFWIEELYVLFLGRVSDPGGNAYWSDQVQSSAMTRSQVASVLLSSDEATETQIEALYARWLARNVEAGAVTFWRPFLRDQGERALSVVLASSTEGIAIGENWPP